MHGINLIKALSLKKAAYKGASSASVTGVLGAFFV